MKTPSLIRAAAGVAAATLTLVLFHAIALLASPAPGEAPQMAQAAVSASPR